MRYLFAIPPEDGAEASSWADDGDPVVPQFPTTGENHWLSVNSFKPAPYARVGESEHIDLDAYAAKLVKEYPGLPRELHEEYVIRTAKLAYMLPIGHRIQVYITSAVAKVMDVETEEWIELWNKQPLPLH